MKQQQFENLYAERWNRFEVLLQEAELSRPLNPLELKEFAQLYRKVCHFHSLAKERRYSSYMVDKLGELIVRGHQQLYKRKTDYRQKMIQFFLADFPCLVRKEARFFWVATALFYVPALIYFIVVLLKPELVYGFLDPMTVIQLESMYNPENRLVGEAREAATNWHMFGFYIRNNISVAFNCFASGFVWCLGSIFFLVFNSLLLGSVSGHMVNVDYSETFFTFVIGHGSFELTAIVLSGAAGLKMGYALIAPGNYSRLEALKRAASIAIKLMFGVIAMLVIAAFIEAFWSSNNLFLAWQKYLVGAVLWAVVFIYLAFAGKQAELPDKTEFNP